MAEKNIGLGKVVKGPLQCKRSQVTHQHLFRTNVADLCNAFTCTSIALGQILRRHK